MYFMQNHPKILLWKNFSLKNCNMDLYSKIFRHGGTKKLSPPNYWPGWIFISLFSFLLCLYTNILYTTFHSPHSILCQNIGYIFIFRHGGTEIQIFDPVWKWEELTLIKTRLLFDMKKVQIEWFFINTQSFCSNLALHQHGVSSRFSSRRDINPYKSI